MTARASEAYPRRRSFYSELSELARIDLIEIGVHRTYAPGEMLAREGDPWPPVQLLLDGWAIAKAFTPSREEVLLRLLGPGDLVGADAALLGEPLRESVVSRTNMTVLATLPPRFTDYVSTAPGVARAIVSSALDRAHQADQRIKHIGGGLAENRLAALLLELAGRCGVPERGGGVALVVPLAQAELARWVAVSRESAARTFRTWRQDRVVTTGRRRITILKPEVLGQLADAHLMASP